VTPRSGGYPLAALEGLRRRTLEAARAELAAAVAESDAARARAGAAAERLQEAALARRTAEETPAGPSAAALEVRGRWLARVLASERLLRDEAERREEVAVRMAGEEESWRGRVVDAERQLRAIERHRSLWERARWRARQAAEEREQDDRTGALGRPPARGGYFPAS
jgi:hypothetical protein